MISRQLVLLGQTGDGREWIIFQLEPYDTACCKVAKLLCRLKMKAFVLTEHRSCSKSQGLGIRILRLQFSALLPISLSILVFLAGEVCMHEC